MDRKKVLVVGAGVGGLAAALDLAVSGAEVTLLERAPVCGGKLRQETLGGAKIDAGPTVFTMRWVFEALFRDAGLRLEERLSLHPAKTLARHAWRGGGQLDLLADSELSAREIERFAGREDAEGYRAFCERSRAIYRTLEGSFIAAQRPSPLDLVKRIGPRNPGALFSIAPFQTLWRALGKQFRDPRLRQLFARYATYCGSSPFAAPATLMLVAHVEQEGVWIVEEGMAALARSLQTAVEEKGVTLRCNAEVERILLREGRIAGVRLSDGEELLAESLVFNGDVSALASGLLGEEASRAAPVTKPEQRSLSAVTWCFEGRAEGFDLSHHNVFFAEDYEAEFRSIFREGRITGAPTVYLCAQDRGEGRSLPREGGERLFALINAPARGDLESYDQLRIDELWGRADEVMRACGLQLEVSAGGTRATTPEGFHRLFPGTGGALYGRANHGAFASFARPGSASRIKGLYLAGGSVHPGPGVPMAALSGRLAAARWRLDQE